jgi:2,3-bisphosphoglycerate-independent phosphoglycerate mutase
MTDKVPYTLIILDGWGHRVATDANAIALANTPVWDNLWANKPHSLISSSGEDVGLPAGQMGNSEVGHMTLGAGRRIDQDLTRINHAIKDGSLNDNPTLLASLDQLAHSGHALHLLGLLSKGGVHSHELHIQAIVSLAFKRGVKAVYVHAFLDGRDVPPRSAEASLQAMQDHINSHIISQGSSQGQGGIASVVGRYYAMDRDNRWERVQPAFELLNSATPDYEYPSAVEALQAAYTREESDEFVKPTAVLVNGQRVVMQDGDGVIFMNFRADRARELSRCFLDTEFTAFPRQHLPKLSSFVTLTQYAADIKAPYAFGPANLSNSLGEYVASLGKTQLRLAETEKYAHVTFFFSGGREAEYAGESRRLIPSPRVATYDLQPQMSAIELTDELTQAIKGADFDLIICNYANGDMVGHTGNLAAAIEAVECLDSCLGHVIEALRMAGGHCLITADHGNVEQMTDAGTGQAHTAPTSELVPLIYVGDKAIELTQTRGTLADIAPTLLGIMNVPQPIEMTGTSMIINNPARSRVATGET